MPVEEGDTLAFTVSEGEDVLELIKSDAEGIFVREDGDWVKTDSTKDQPTIEDQEWIDVSEDAIDFWDRVSNEDNAITRSEVLLYATATK